ncbi:hypothetical protein ACJJTC_016533 [Scirpophaga incertulas]
MNIKNEVKKLQQPPSSPGPSTSTASPSANTELTEPRLSTPDWKKEVNHVERPERKYWDDDHLEDINQRELIISLGGEDSSDSEICSSESDSESEVTTGIVPLSYSDYES